MPAFLRPGEIVLSKYRIERLLGEGGMGIVVAAHHLGLDRRVALKLLRAEALGEPTVRERFAREARAVSRIDSEHVARVLDVDTLADGTPFIVMEHLEGSDLAHLLDTGHRLDVRDATRYIVEACRGIQEAHRIGIVHRDIKPGNLFLETTAGGSSRIKVLDFGIAKAVSEAPEAAAANAGDTPASPGITQVNSVVGSPNYMSPEQMLTPNGIDGRADIWGLGITLYELLTGEMPFPAKSYQQLVAQVAAGAAVPPSRYRPDLPRGLEAVILRCLAKDPSARFQTVADLAAALLPYTRPEPRSPRWHRLAIAAAALGLTGISVAAWARVHADARAAQAPTPAVPQAPPVVASGGPASAPSTGARPESQPEGPGVAVTPAPPPSQPALVPGDRLAPGLSPASRPPAGVSAPASRKTSPRPPPVPSAPPPEVHTID
jgi:serine/threonine-protein kinase